MSAGATPTLENFGKEMTVSLLGTVIDDLGKPVPKANVSLLTGEVVVAVATSDENGEFGFPQQMVKVGFYTLRAAKPQYDPADEQLTLIWEMANLSLDVVLRLRSHDLGLEMEEAAEAARRQWKEAAEEAWTKRKEAAAEEARRQRREEDDLQEERRQRGEEDDLQEARRQRREEDELRERRQREQTLGTTEEAPEDVPSEIPPSSDEKAKYVRIRILYATDRNRLLSIDPTTNRLLPSKDPKKMFGGEWAANEQVSFGACDVQLPYDRKVGTSPRPSIFKLEFREDPNKHIIIKSCEDLAPEQFFREVSDRGPSVLFFVHGYCVTFAEAIYKTAQIVDDIGFGGAPICYSWPSNGHFWAYTTDEDSILWTRQHLLTVLRETMKLTGVQTINIIAHSMGNRAVVECLDAIAQEFSGTGRPNQINQVVFAAPDVNAGVFRQFLNKIKGAAKRFTLYASSNDKPLKWSQWFRSWDRAGQGGPKLVLHPILDSIDASHVPCGVLDHSYYGATFTVLGDLHELFSYNSPPPRFAIKGPKNDGNGDYWEIKT